MNTITVNGVEVPAPMNVAPPVGTRYYVPRGTFTIHGAIWDGDAWDLDAFDNGLAFAERAHADAYNKAKHGLKVATRQIVTRKEAKAAGQARFFIGKPCKHGNVEPRYTSSGECTCGACRCAKLEANRESYQAKRAAESVEIQQDIAQQNERREGIDELAERLQRENPTASSTYCLSVAKVIWDGSRSAELEATQRATENWNPVADTSAALEAAADQSFWANMTRSLVLVVVAVLIFAAIMAAVVIAVVQG